jgi:hypothetical protein
MLGNMLTTYLAASLVPLAAAIAVPQQTYDFVSLRRLIQVEIGNLPGSNASQSFRSLWEAVRPAWHWERVSANV